MPGYRCHESHVFDRRSPESGACQRRIVKLHAEKGLPVKRQPLKVAIFEVYAIKDTVLKNCFSEIDHIELDVGQFYTDEFCTTQLRRAEVGADKDGFTEARIREVTGRQV